MSHGRSALCWSSALFATTLIVMSYLGWLPAQSLLYFLSSAERKENKMKNLVVRYFTGKLVYQGDSTPVTINGKLGLTWGSLFLIRNRTESKEKTTKLKTYFFYHTPVPIQAQLHPFLHHFSAPCCGLPQQGKLSSVNWAGAPAGSWAPHGYSLTSPAVQLGRELEKGKTHGLR